jgi:hypothetical protein
MNQRRWKARRYGGDRRKFNYTCVFPDRRVKNRRGVDRRDVKYE